MNASMSMRKSLSLAYESTYILRTKKEKGTDVSSPHPQMQIGKVYKLYLKSSEFRLLHSFVGRCLAPKEVFE